MGKCLQVKRSKFWNELSEAKQEEYFNITEKKFLPTIDNLYFSVFIQDDGKKIRPEGSLQSLLKKLEIKKEEALSRHEPVDFEQGLMMAIKSYSFYRFCLSEPDLYDIFICNSLPNDDTPRILIQLRALGLWTRGVEEMILDAFNRISALLEGYDLSIDNCRENRIDYCYHTNAISSPNKIFRETAGRINYLHTNLKHATIHADLEHMKIGTLLHKNYICFGRTDSNNVRARIYDKVKEVIEMGYKDFFFKIWHDNGLISYYDKWCMEYAFPYRNVDYLAKASLAFYVEHLLDGEFYEEYEKALKSKNTTMAEFKRLAGEWMPSITSVINIEYETKRKFYYYSDKYIEKFKHESRNIPRQLNRIYKILDNRSVFLDYLTSKTLSFHKGKDDQGEIRYQSWWKRLRNTKLGGLESDEQLLRDYAYEMDKRYVPRRTINNVASSAVYDDRVDTGFIEDISDLLSDVSDNSLHKNGRLLFVDEDGEIADELYGSLLRDYRVIKAKKETQLRNRKKRLDT